MTGTYSQLDTKPWIRRVLLVFALLCLALPLSARESSVMRFDRIDVSDGLSQSSVLAVAQDPTGFLWFATEAGVDRYDGFEFTNYGRDRSNPDTLASDFARDLHFAPDGSQPTGAACLAGTRRPTSSAPGGTIRATRTP